MHWKSCSGADRPNFKKVFSKPRLISILLICKGAKLVWSNLSQNKAGQYIFLGFLKVSLQLNFWVSILDLLIWSLWEVWNIKLSSMRIWGNLVQGYELVSASDSYGYKCVLKMCCLFLAVSEGSASWQEKQLICISSWDQVVWLLCPCPLSPLFLVQCQCSLFHDKSRQT